MKELHARLGPSNKRWPECAGSVREEARFPDIAGEAAIDGTGSHILLELCVDNNVRAEHYLGLIIGDNHHDKPNGWLVAQDRCGRVQMCLDYIARRITELTKEYPGCKISVESETKADPGGYFGRTDWWGTVDITITVMNGRLCMFVEACDYKDGKGWVHVPGNTQLFSYVGGKMRPFIGSGPDKVRPFNSHLVSACRISVVQPKTNPPVRYEDMQTSKVMEELAKMNKAAYATDDPNAPLTPGKHCQWCRANTKRGGDCTAESQKSLATVRTMSDEITIQDGQNLFEYIGKAVADPTALTVDKLTELADAGPGILAAFDAVNKEIERRIGEGEKIPGYAMLPGNDKQVYNLTDDEIAGKLKGLRMKKDQIYPAKLITPAQVLKSNLLKPEQKERFAKSYITKIASEKLSLKKVAYEEPSAEDMFAGIPTPSLFDKSEETVRQCNTNDVESVVSDSSSDTPPSFF